MTVGVTDEQWDFHLLLLYQEESDRRDGIAPWIQRGLDRGEKILLAQVPGDTATLPWLTQRGVDISMAAGRGQFSVLPVKEFYPPEGQAALVERALGEGYPGVRLAAHANAALSHLAEDGYRAADRRLDELCRRLPVSGLCQCDTGRITAEFLGSVIDSHPDALLERWLRLRRSADLIVAAGEIDLRSASTVARWLRRACPPEPSSELVIELSELTFLDLAGCRALIHGTAEFRAKGGVVFLQGLRGHTGRVVRLCEVDRIAGVALE